MPTTFYYLLNILPTVLQRLYHFWFDFKQTFRNCKSCLYLVTLSGVYFVRHVRTSYLLSWIVWPVHSSSLVLSSSFSRVLPVAIFVLVQDTSSRSVSLNLFLFVAVTALVLRCWDNKQQYTTYAHILFHFFVDNHFFICLELYDELERMGEIATHPLH